MLLETPSLKVKTLCEALDLPRASYYSIKKNPTLSQDEEDLICHYLLICVSLFSLCPVLNVFIADGSGGGSWGTANEAVDIGDEPPGARIDVSPHYEQYLSCITKANLNIDCVRETDGDTTPTVQSITGQVSSTTYGAAIRDYYSYDFNFERVTGNQAVIFYSDNTAITKIKTYDWRSSTLSSATLCRLHQP